MDGRTARSLREPLATRVYFSGKEAVRFPGEIEVIGDCYNQRLLVKVDLAYESKQMGLSVGFLIFKIVF